MRLLAIETATEVCSLALWLDGEVRERRYRHPRQHARHLLPSVDALLAEAGLALASLDALAFGRGPGSFTGVRIAAGVVQGLALGANLPVVPVSTLLALGQAALAEGPARPVLAALDARMGEVYFLACRPGAEGLLAPASEEGVYPPERVPLPPEAGWLAAGSGWEAHAALRHRAGQRVARFVEGVVPTAAAVARLAARAYRQGCRLPPEAAVPVYLRERVADERARVDG
ncbi:MAG: tRNA (adenosine(37)-N6)-threonylcarbamoyltransferase complex dimerization subunit type 1 TsaB [Gammaproteobacteria bacterium]|nr:MAG: tRNA (adenosine(37)-N6)-threonylcarbamoyltransferase complex dimerization subunit type 1 TsaB [Gammaproteobacteria bacterium]